MQYAISYILRFCIFKQYLRYSALVFSISNFKLRNKTIISKYVAYYISNIHLIILVYLLYICCFDLNITINFARYLTLLYITFEHKGPRNMRYTKWWARNHVIQRRHFPNPCSLVSFIRVLLLLWMSFS